MVRLASFAFVSAVLLGCSNDLDASFTLKHNNFNPVENIEEAVTPLSPQNYVKFNGVVDDKPSADDFNADAFCAPFENFQPNTAQYKIQSLQKLKSSSWPLKIKLTPDGRYLLYKLYWDKALYIYDTQENQLIDRLLPEEGVTFSKGYSSRSLYVSNMESTKFYWLSADSKDYEKNNTTKWRLYTYDLKSSKLSYVVLNAGQTRQISYEKILFPMAVNSKEVVGSLCEKNEGPYAHQTRKLLRQCKLTVFSPSEQRVLEPQYHVDGKALKSEIKLFLGYFNLEPTDNNYIYRFTTQSTGRRLNFSYCTPEFEREFGSCSGRLYCFGEVDIRQDTFGVNCKENDTFYPRDRIDSEGQHYRYGASVILDDNDKPVSNLARVHLTATNSGPYKSKGVCIPDDGAGSRSFWQRKVGNAIFVLHRDKIIRFDESFNELEYAFNVGEFNVSNFESSYDGNTLIWNSPNNDGRNIFMMKLERIEKGK